MPDKTEDDHKKVVSLENKRRQKPQSGSRVKLKINDLAAATSTVMSRRPSPWPSFPDKFHVVADDSGERLAFVEQRGTVKRISDQGLDSAIVKYWDTVLPRSVDIGPQLMTSVHEARKKFISAADPLDMSQIKPVAFKSDPSLTFHRLAFNPTWDAGTDLARAFPLTYELLTRTSNADALAVWIGSLFDPNSNRHQYAWLTGSGGDGKGTLIRMLARVFGPSFSSEQPPAQHDRFWTSGLIGKRLVVFPDMNDSKFVTTGLFKSLSGGDKVRVEFKRGATVAIDLPAKYLFSSNKRPSVTDNPADMRRIIYCYVRPVVKRYTDGDYEYDMARELPHFISFCVHRYELHRASTSLGADVITTDTAEVEEIARHNTAEWDNIIDTHFAKTGQPDSVLTARRMEEILKHYYPHSKFERDALRTYICEASHVGKSERVRIKGERVRVYPGIYAKARHPNSG